MRYSKRVDALIAAGADIDEATNNGSTALMFAANDGHRNDVDALIAAGADIDKARTDGATALMFAAQNGHHKVVAALLAAGAANTLGEFREHLSKLDDTDISLNLSGIMKRYQTLRKDTRFIGFFSSKETCTQKAAAAHKIIEVMESIEDQEANEAKAEERPRLMLSLTPDELTRVSEKNSALGIMFAVFKTKYSNKYNISTVPTSDPTSKGTEMTRITGS